MTLDVVRLSKNIHEIDLIRNLRHFAKDFAAEYFLHFGIVNRNRDNIEAGPDKIFGNIVCRLVRLCRGLYAQHGDTLGLQDQSTDLRGSDDYVVLPIQTMTLAGIIKLRQAMKSRIIEQNKTRNKEARSAVTFGLHAEQTRVDAFLTQQLAVASHLRNTAFLNHHDAVGHAHGGKPM